MCFWSRLMQLLQGDDILGDFITITLETVFYISRLKTYTYVNVYFNLKTVL